MLKMLVIADDFTGALDTGVKFSEIGVSTKVLASTQVDFSSRKEDILTICAPTRHLSYQKAYQIVRELVEQAAAVGVECIFKKTDSALRGNIGAELSAVLDGSGAKSIGFFPALPVMNRVTINGIHYVNGLPVNDSVFGQDPFDPVTESYVPSLLHQQCSVPTWVITREELDRFPLDEHPGIYIFDAEKNDDIVSGIQALERGHRLRYIAGCSGVAEILSSYLNISRETIQIQQEFLSDRMIAVCGSMNPISCAQMDVAEASGTPRVHIPSEQLYSTQSLQEGTGKEFIDYLFNIYQQSGDLLLDTQQCGGNSFLENNKSLNSAQSGQQVATRIGQILKALLDLGVDARLMIIGGDTFLAFIEQIGCWELSPIREVAPGVVLSRVSYAGSQYDVISKSGGFGDRDLLRALYQDCIPNGTHTQEAVS